MWDNFWRYAIYGITSILIVIAVVSCVGGCAMGSKKSGSEDLIETAGESGCHIKSIKFREGQIDQIDCHDTVRYVR